MKKPISRALPQNSAEGAQYESQGQVRSEAKHVAPGCDPRARVRPERPKYLSRPFRATQAFFSFTQGRRASLRFALAPGFHISRRWRFVVLLLAFVLFHASAQEQKGVGGSTF